MDPWIILHYLLYLLEIIGFFFIGVIVAVKNKTPVNRSFACFSFLVAAWQVTQLLSQVVSADRFLAVLLLHTSVAISGLMVAAFWIFTLIYSGKNPRKRNYYIPGMLVGALSFLSSGINEVSIGYGGIGIPRLDFWYACVLAFGAASVIAGVFTIVMHAKNAKDSKQRYRDGIVIISMSLAGSFVILASFYTSSFSEGVLAQHLIPTAVLLAMVSFIYALRKGLIDIRAAAVRTVVYILVLATLSIIYYILAYLVSVVLFHDNARNIVIISPVNIILALILAFLFQPIRRFFDRVTNSIFYRDAYNSDKFFATLSSLLASTTELRGLLERASLEITTTFKTEQAFFFLYRENLSTKHISAGSSGHARLPVHDAKMLDLFMSTTQGDVFLTDSLPEDSQAYRMLISHKIGLVMPLRRERNIVGYLLLGDQQTGGYKKRDIDVLTTVADELVIAIQNALSLQEIKEINATLQQRIDNATKELRSKNAQLRHLDEIKDEFISMASHQLRTPLTSVKGYISMMIEGDTGDISAQQRKVLEEAFNSSERMVRLIADFLNVSRLQTGKFAIERVPTDMTRLVKEEVDSLRVIASTHDLKLLFHAPKNIPLLNVDEAKVRQVMMNFIDNAIYYSQPNSMIKIVLKQEEDAVIFTVSDTGIGVPEDEQQHLFDRFFRASNARKQRPDGTGVGLYLAKKIILAHGGQMIFDSVEAQGSTFGFRLPLRGANIYEQQ